jgi:anthranilate phosphoribosyltransferase
VLQRLGSEHVLVVHGRDGLDEITLNGDTLVAELKDGVVSEYMVNPTQFGLAEHDGSALKAGSREASLAIVRRVIDNEPGPARDIVLLNAGAAIYAANVAASLAEGVEHAREALSSGKAGEALFNFVQASQAFAPRA